MLVRLNYVSYSNANITDEDIQEILVSSRVNNKNRNITGLLMYSDRYFFQCLEGERKEVNKTYVNILSDSRHSKCTISSYTQVTSRLFPVWAMEQVKFSGVNNALVNKYSESGLFQPHEFSPAQAEAFLADVARISEQEALKTEKTNPLISWFKS